MALKKTTILKRKIEKRLKNLEDSTKALLKELSNVTEGAELFFREKMKQYEISTVWGEVEMSQNGEEVVIKGFFTINGQQAMANVMVVHVPITMAVGCTAQEIAEYMLKTSEGTKKNMMIESERLRCPPPQETNTEFDLSLLSKDQLHELRMYNLSRGGKQ